MRICRWFPAAVAALVVVCPTPARAQLFEDVGTRAQGMGGAFVAVADDATAAWWNPAGIATGALFDVIIEKGHSAQPEEPVGLELARRVNTYGFAAAFPSLGVSHFRIRTSQVEPVVNAIDPLAQDRQEPGGVGHRVRSLAANQFGVTIAQSLGRHLVLGSTVKLLRGGVGSAVVDETTEDPLEVGDDLELLTSSRFDLDAGAMVSVSLLRLGLTVRNLTRPGFGEGSDRVVLERQARAGLAVLIGASNAATGLTLSADVDLTKTETAFGEVKHVATGAELWLIKRRLGVRGGLADNRLDDSGVTSSTGFSVALTQSFLIEGARVFGSDGSGRSWSSNVRVTF